MSGMEGADGSRKERSDKASRFVIRLRLRPSNEGILVLIASPEVVKFSSIYP